MSLDIRFFCCLVWKQWWMVDKPFRLMQVIKFWMCWDVLGHLAGGVWLKFPRLKPFTQIRKNFVTKPLVQTCSAHCILFYRKICWLKLYSCVFPRKPPNNNKLSHFYPCMGSSKNGVQPRINDSQSFSRYHFGVYPIIRQTHIHRYIPTTLYYISLYYPRCYLF